MTVRQDRVSDTVTLTSGDSGSVVGVIEFRDGLTITPTNFLVSYSNSASAQTAVAIYDEPHDATSKSEDKKITEVQVSPGDNVDLTGLDLENVYDGVVVVAENNDDEVSVTVGGEVKSG
jgi:hypothetical protein